MIITDPSQPPSKRFFEILNKYFFTANYTFKKNCFNFFCADRIDTVYITFLKWGHLVSAQLSWSISFTALDKALKQLNGSKRKLADSTLATGLLNYPECRKDKVKTDFHLYDAETLQYDHFSINVAATEIINSYEKYVAPFFNKFHELRQVEKELNANPIKIPKFMSIEKHIISGLILAKNYRANSFEEISKSYEAVLDNSNYNDKKEYKIMLYNAIDYLKKNNIKLPD
jgi:hypothetical protein